MWLNENALTFWIIKSYGYGWDVKCLSKVTGSYLELLATVEYRASLEAGWVRSLGSCLWREGGNTCGSPFSLLPDHKEASSFAPLRLPIMLFSFSELLNYEDTDTTKTRQESGLSCNLRSPSTCDLFPSDSFKLFRVPQPPDNALEERPSVRALGHINHD